MFLLHLIGSSAKLNVNPLENVKHSLGSWNDVEGRWNRSSVFEIGDPQFTPGKFPLSISSLLKFIENSRKHVFKIDTSLTVKRTFNSNYFS